MLQASLIPAFPDGLARVLLDCEVLAAVCLSLEILFPGHKSRHVGTGAILKPTLSLADNGQRFCVPGWFVPEG